MGEFLSMKLFTKFDKNLEQLKSYEKAPWLLSKKDRKDIQNRNRSSLIELLKQSRADLERNIYQIEIFTSTGRESKFV